MNFIQKSILAILVMASFFSGVASAQALKKTPTKVTKEVTSTEDKSQNTTDQSENDSEDETSTETEDVEAAKPQPAPAKTVNKKVSVVNSGAGKHSVGIGIGQTFLFRRFDDHGNDKLTSDIYYGYAASYSFDFMLNGHFSKHDKNDDYSKLIGLTASIKSKFFDFDNFSPYLLGGLGFYRPQARRNGIDTVSKYTFGFNLGAGVDLRLNPHYLVGILGHFHKPFEVEQDGQRDLAGSYFKLMFLIMYTF
jgi:opacity protein-like surface antigen